MLVLPSLTDPPPPQSTPDSGCSGFCANASSYLSEADVQTIIAQAVNEAQAQGKPAVITVIDRVGNVLGVYLHGLFENGEVIHALFGHGAPSLEQVFERLALGVGQWFDPQSLALT